MNDLYKNKLKTQLIELKLSKVDLFWVKIWFEPKNDELETRQWCNNFIRNLKLNLETSSINFPIDLIDDLICSIGNIAYSGYRCKIPTRRRAKIILNSIEEQTNIWKTKYISIEYEKTI